jgi:hypothetical protein
MANSEVRTKRAIPNNDQSYFIVPVPLHLSS